MQESELLNGSSYGLVYNLQAQKKAIIILFVTILIKCLQFQGLIMEMMDNTLHSHDYEDRISYPHQELIQYDHHDNILTRSKNQLYGDSLLSISRHANANMDRVKQKLMLIDPCRAYGLEHWHPENSKYGKHYLSNIELVVIVVNKYII